MSLSTLITDCVFISFPEIEDYLKNNNFKITNLVDKYLIFHNNSNIPYNGIICDLKNPTKVLSYYNELVSEISDTNLIDDTIITNNVCQELIDGSLIRCYYHNDKWNLATKKKDAYQSKWHSTKSFGEMFDECAKNLNYDFLDKNVCYLFVIQHPENKIVVQYNEPNIIHIGSIDLTTLQYINTDIPDIKKPISYKFENANELVESFNNKDHTFMGYTLFSDEQKRIQILNPMYSYVKSLIGNMPNMKFRFLSILKENSELEFLKYYPEYYQDLMKVKGEILTLAEYLNELYDISYKRKRQINIPDIYKSFLGKNHQKYKETGNYSNISTILETIYECPLFKLASTLGYTKAN